MLLMTRKNTVALEVAYKAQPWQPQCVYVCTSLLQVEETLHKQLLPCLLGLLQ